MVLSTQSTADPKNPGALRAGISLAPFLAMDRCGRTRTSTIVALYVGAFFFTAAPGRAQENDPTDLDLRLRYDAPPPTPEALPPPVRRECKPRYMAGPGVGLTLGMASIGFGGVMIGFATDDDPFGISAEKGSIAGGSLMIAAGLAAIVYSGIKATLNGEKRARVCSV